MKESPSSLSSKVERDDSTLSLPGALVLAFVLVGLIHAAVMGLSLPRALGVWFPAQYFAAGQLIAVGLLGALLTKLASGLAFRWRRRLLLTLVVASFGIFRLILEDDANGPAEKAAQWVSEEIVYWLFGIVATLLISGAMAVSLAVSRPSLRILLVATACVAGVCNAVVLPLAYAGLHGAVALGTALLIAGALSGISVPRWAARPLSLANSGRRVFILCGVGIVLTFPAFLLPPSNPVLLALLHQPAAVMIPAVAQLRSGAGDDAHIPANQVQWFTDRSQLAPIPPTEPQIPGSRDLVILIGIDSMRADLLEDESYRKRLPELFRLRDESVWFDNARSPGSSTAPALAALFSGVHFSQMYWSLHTRRRPETFPHEDKTPRFPALLAQAGITTSTVDSAGWLLNSFGIVSGFTEEMSARKPKKRGYPNGREYFKDLRAQIERGTKKEGSKHFLFVHYLDAHSPYTSAGQHKSKFDGYIAELGLVDQELGRIRKLVAKRKLEDRTTIIVFSDHGEAFGEHGLTWHGSTLYDVMIRVPLLMRVPGVSPRREHGPVSVIDIGPTVLDLFSVSTPPHIIGQSLVPLLQGREFKLTRPLISEARLKRSLVDSNFKLIHDTRSGTVELYDLENDPQELENLYVAGDSKSQQLLGTLTAFFKQHTHRRPGYKVPYRKW